MRQIPEHVDPLSCEVSKKMWIDGKQPPKYIFFQVIGGYTIWKNNNLD